MRSILFIFLVFFGAQQVKGQNSISVMNYNLLMFPDAYPLHREDTLAKILEKHPIDILGVCELLTKEGSDSILNRALNKHTQKYKAAQFIDASKGDLHQMLYYNSDKLTLYSQTVIPSNTRDFNEYILYLNTASLASGDTTFLDVYVCHLKAGSDTTNQRLRSENVQYLMDYLKAGSPGRNRIIMGDFNVYTDQEEAYQKLTKGSIYPFYDPLDQEGNWHNNSGYKNIFTQSTRSAQLYGEGAGGGMDDRFDFILTSYNVLDTSNSIHYKENSYAALGNSGDCFNKSITDCTGDAELLSALYYMSDHLPVVMDLELKEAFIKSIAKPMLATEKVWFSQDAMHVETTNQSNFIVYNALGIEVYRSVEKGTSFKVESELFQLHGVYFIHFLEGNSLVKTVK